MLTVSGEPPEEHEEKHEGYLSRERAVGRFERSIGLPDNVKTEDIQASFKDGVLTIKVPRVAESTPAKSTSRPARNRLDGRPPDVRGGRPALLWLELHRRLDVTTRHAALAYGNRLGDTRLLPLAIALALHLVSLLVRSGVWCGFCARRFPTAGSGFGRRRGPT